MIVDLRAAQAASLTPARTGWCGVATRTACGSRYPKASSDGASAPIRMSSLMVVRGGEFQIEFEHGSQATSTEWQRIVEKGVHI